jgi:hypothetical protein
MSIFKTIGSKLKRVISLKNVISAATGNFTAVTADMARVMTTKSPSELKKEADSKANGIAYVSPEQTIPTFEIPQVLQASIDSAGEKQAAKMSSAIASSGLAQNNLDAVNKFALKVWWDAMWLKNKPFILGLGGLIVVFIGWKVLAKPSNAAKSGRKRR